MKYMRQLFVHLLTLLLLLGAPAMPAVSQLNAATSQMTAQQKKKAKAQAQKAKAKAKAQAKKDKEKAKAQAKKDKAAAQRAKEKEKAQAAKEKAAAKKTTGGFGSTQMMASTKAAADRIAARTSYHHLSFWGGAGYSGLIDKFPTQTEGWSPVNGEGLPVNAGGFDPKFQGGGGGLLGVGYELRHKQFLFRVGPEFRLFSHTEKMLFTDPSGDKDLIAPFDYSRGDYAEMVQHFRYDKFKETQAVGQLMVPILFGATFDKWYFMAGTKIGYTLFSPYRQRGVLTTTVTDPWAMEDWSDVYRHFLETAKIDDHTLFTEGQKGKNKFGFDVTLSAEAGINLNDFMPDEWQARNEDRRFPLHMRVAAFIDYGLPILKAGGENQLLAATGNYRDGAPEMASHSLYQSTLASSKLSSLLVGVRFTASLQLNKPKIPNPFICFLVTDTLGQQTRTTATVEIRQPNMPKRKPKLRKMGKGGKLDIRYPKDLYEMVARAPGYLPSDWAGDTLRLDHQVDGDSAVFRLIPEPYLVTYVVNAETGEMMDATVAFNSRITQGTHHNKTGYTTPEGPCVIGLNYGDTYEVIASKEGFHTDSMYIERLTDTLRFELRPIHRVKHKLVLNHMYFAVDQTDILPTSEEDIMKLYNFLNENPRIRVLITGHTDSDGDEAHNQVLSEGRAESLKNEMIKRGIDASRIETNGKGETEPIDTNDTEIGRQNNRRVEVTVLNADQAEDDVW